MIPPERRVVGYDGEVTASVSEEHALLEVLAAAEKDIGGRTHDEDGVLVRADLGLYAVADGAGGENAGNLASSIALATLARELEASRDAAQRAPTFDAVGLATQARRLSAAVHRANRDVLEIARSSARYRGMGTTVVALVVLPSEGIVHLAHVGDSRCYRLRAGRLELMTSDHSLANDVLEMRPDLPDEALLKLPRNVITRALGMNESVRVTVRSLDVAPGDRFVLCTDGLTDALSDEAIGSALLTTASVEEHARELVAEARAAQTDDNVAVVVVGIEAAPGVTSVPKRHATRPPPRRRSSSPPPRADRGDPSDPEIIVVESDSEEIPLPEVHVVPESAATRSMRSVLADLVSPRRRAVVPRPGPEEE